MILCIDTAGPVLGAALGTPSGVRSWSLRQARGAERALTPALAELLEGVSSLELILLTSGPGSFTSLRVGVAAGLGLAVSMDCPVMALSSLEARARLAGDAPRVLSLLDARKGRAYAGWYGPEGLIGEELDQTIESILSEASPGFVAVGEGALVWSKEILAAGGSVHPRAAESPVSLWVENCPPGARLPPEDFRLHYLRPPDACLASPST